MWVVKLGGSLLRTEALRGWLKLLAEEGDGKVVIVPGGGVFADAVRATQATAGFDDVAAHRMALLAMEQYAWVLKSLLPELTMASSELEIAERSWQHRAIVWLPSRMVLADEHIAPSWDVTSDSLAAWLAHKVSADRLILIKHADHSSQPVAMRALIEAGVLDQAFAEFAARLHCPIHVIGIAQHAQFRRLLAGEALSALTRE